MTGSVAQGARPISAATGGGPLAEDGPVAILIHGAGMDRSVWSLQTRWLAHHGCPTLAIDLPGHGSSPEAERASIGDYADWMAALVHELDRPVHLVGHSMGSYIALETAARAPIASLTLVGTAASMPVHPALLEAATDDLVTAARLMSGWGFAPAVRTGPHPSPGASMVGQTVGLITRSRPGVLAHDLDICSAYERAAERCSQGTAPTCFLLGEVDRMTPVRAAQPLFDAAGAGRDDVRVVVVPGVGHMVPIEAPIITRTTIAEAVLEPHG